MPKKLLLVDDTEFVRSSVCDSLRLAFGDRLSIEEARDGKIAVDMVHSGQELPDLILMDVHMPVMGGIEATKALRMDGYGNRPIVLYSTKRYPISEVQEIGATDFVLKTDVDAVKMMVARYLGIEPSD
jgi:CheY-like chemotaxis protein